MKRLLLLCALCLVVGGGCRKPAVTPAVPMWPQPVRVSRMNEAAARAPGARRLLRQNGFVVLSRAESWCVQSDYLNKCHQNFITSDAVLYVFHCFFRGGLNAYEKRDLLPRLKRLVANALAEAQAEATRRSSDALLAEPARRNVVLFGVAQALLTGQTPAVEQAAIGRQVALINDATQYGYYPQEDYTQYRPRGPYADDADLRAYFRAMKWLSRVILPVTPGSGDREPEASIKLRQAYLLGRLCEQSAIRRDWQQLYDEISFLCAAPDSFTPPAFYRVARRFGSTLDDGWVRRVRAEFDRPSYPASAICSVLQPAPGTAPARYVQFMGERYIPDAAIHQRATYPHTRRFLPTGLDIPFALFGDERAGAHMTDQFAADPRLRPALEALRGEFRTYGDAGGSVYGDWVAAIRTLAHPPPGKRLPRFLTTEAWRDKSLTTELAAWATMRHDFVLYGKQCAPPGCAGMTFYVEPVPELYVRLGKTAAKLQQRGFAGMGDLAGLCGALRVVAQNELDGVDPMDGLDRVPPPEGGSGWYFYIGSFGQWLLQRFTPVVGDEHPAVIADVATSSVPPYPVLHAATGPLNLILAQNQEEGMPPYMGLVFSYYEFTRDGAHRLTDAQWEKMARAGKHRRYRPEWTQSYLY